MIPAQVVEVDLPDLTLNEARMVVDQIRKTTIQFQEHMEQAANDADALKHLIEVAYTQRAWVALGYDSWKAMAEVEFDSARLWSDREERRAIAQHLLNSVGMSTRAIGDVLGVNSSTVSRDLATAASASVATATQSLDGKARPRQRPTPQEVVDRGLKVAELRAEGKSQAEIGAALGVSQRTISSDDRMVQSWKEKLAEPEREKLATGKLTRSEIGDLVGIAMVSSTAASMQRVTENGARSLIASLDFLRDDVILADAWPSERHACSTALASTFVTAVNQLATWLDSEIAWDHIGHHERAAAQQLILSSITRLESVVTTTEPAPHQ